MPIPERAAQFRGPVRVKSRLGDPELRLQFCSDQQTSTDYVAMTRAKGDCHLSAARTRFIPEKLLGLFEQAAWPLAPAGTAARPASQGPKVDIGARMRGMWR